MRFGRVGTLGLLSFCCAGLLVPAGLRAPGGAGARALAAPASPPHPAANCQPSSPVSAISAIDYCRAREHVGPVRLPSNWKRLTSGEQLFVLIDLERVNRGLAPIVGLSRAVDALAQKGADLGVDPPFPSAGFSSAGSIWWGTGDVSWAVYYWMYVDGPGGGNRDCPRRGAAGCWLHRDIILEAGSGGALVGGAGHSSTGSAFEILGGYRTSGLVLRWSAELRHFAKPPGVERAQKSSGR